MANEFNGDEEQLRTFFESFDENNNGVLEFNEVTKLVNSLGMHISMEDLKKGFEKIDLGKERLITFEEFAAWWGEQ